MNSSLQQTSVSLLTQSLSTYTSDWALPPYEISLFQLLLSGFPVHYIEYKSCFYVLSKKIILLSLMIELC